MRPRKGSSAFSLIELCVAIAIAAILATFAYRAYKNYEERYRCHSAAQVLLMDLRLQQQRARTMDEPQGIYFESETLYRLGHIPPGGTFKPSNPPRVIDLTRQFSGVKIEQIAGSNVFPKYISFDPKGEDGGEWVILSGFKDVIILTGGHVRAYITVQPNREISVEVK